MGALTHNGEVLQRLPADASQINFDKTGTNLNSTQTENAIKEVNTKVNTNTDDITQLKSGLTNLKNFVSCPDALILESGVTLARKILYTNGSVLYGSVVLDISQVSGSTICHMASGYRPIAEFIAVSMSYATSVDAGTASLVTFGTNGDIRLEHADSKPYLIFNFAYPIAN